MVAESKSYNLFQRLHEVMKEVDYIQKEKKDGMRYTIVSHDAVTAKVRPLMVKHGIIYTASVKTAEQEGTMTKTLVDVTFINIDVPEERHTVTMLGHGIDSQDKGPGKAISYAVKYALLKTLGLETGDDPDNDQDAKKDAKHPATEKKDTTQAERTQVVDQVIATLKEHFGNDQAGAKKAIQDSFGCTWKQATSLGLPALRAGALKLREIVSTAASQ